MSITAKSLDGFTVAGADAALGVVKDVLFDEERWAARYLVVETGLWLDGRRILISLVSVSGIDWNSSRVYVKLTRRKVQRSPAIDTSQPVPREDEAALLDYYGYTYYWSGSYLWGESSFPVPLTAARPSWPTRRRPAAMTQQTGWHLRSAKDVAGCGITDARNEIIGDVENLLFHDGDWSILFVLANTLCGQPSEQILLPPRMIGRITAQRLVRPAPSLATEENMDRDRPRLKEPSDNLHDCHGWHASGPSRGSKLNTAAEILAEDYG